MLSTDELAVLFEMIRETATFGGDNLLAIKLLLALCLRKGELLAARWAELDLDGRTQLGAVSITAIVYRTSASIR